MQSLQPHVPRFCLLCVFELLFPPIDIQHTQCPCRFVILETKALWSQASSHMYIYYIYIILRSTSQVRQQDTGHIRSVPMHAASGLFSWSMAFLSRQFAPTIMDLRPLHIVCTSYISIFPFWASVAGGEGRPRSEAPCSTYGYQFAPWATDGSASAASEIEVGSIYPTTQELRAAAAKQAETCVARMTWCLSLIHV